MIETIFTKWENNGWINRYWVYRSVLVAKFFRRRRWRRRRLLHSCTFMSWIGCLKCLFIIAKCLFIIFEDVPDTFLSRENTMKLSLVPAVPIRTNICWLFEHSLQASFFRAISMQYPIASYSIDTIANSSAIRTFTMWLYLVCFFFRLMLNINSLINMMHCNISVCSFVERNG